MLKNYNCILFKQLIYFEVKLHYKFFFLLDEKLKIFIVMIVRLNYIFKRFFILIWMHT